MPSNLFVPLLVVGMITTGSINSLFYKYQDFQCVENCDQDKSKWVTYEQPGNSFFTLNGPAGSPFS